MTAPQPQTSTTDGMLAQLLIEQAKQGVQLAIITEQLKAVPDHESRIRAVEAQMPLHLEERLGSLETTKARMLGLAASVSVIASAGGTWLGLLVAHR
jgi:hypothetical protein